MKTNHNPPVCAPRDVNSSNGVTTSSAQPEATDLSTNFSKSTDILGYSPSGYSTMRPHLCLVVALLSLLSTFCFSFQFRPLSSSLLAKTEGEIARLHTSRDATPRGNNKDITELSFDDMVRTAKNEEAAKVADAKREAIRSKKEATKNKSDKQYESFWNKQKKSELFIRNIVSPPEITHNSSIFFFSIQTQPR